MPDPAEAQAIFSLLSKGQIPAAAQRAARLLSARPTDADALHLMGLVRKAEQNFNAALPLLQASIDAAPQRAQFRANLANLLGTMGQYPAAIAQYSAALVLDAQFRPARLGLARLQCELAEFAAALQTIAPLTAETSRDAEAWNVRGTALRGQGQYADAESSLRRALTIAPNYPAARHNLGALLGALGDAEASLVELDAAARIGARGPDLEFNRGRALFELGQFAAAEKAYGQAVAFTPDRIDAHRALAQLLYMRGEQDFCQHVRAAAVARPGQATLHLAWADLLRQADQLPDAVAILENLRRRVPANAEVANALAVVLAQQGEFGRAAELARQAVSAAPQHLGFQESLLGVLLARGEAQQALAIAQAATLRSPFDQRWLAYEATALRLLGHPRYHYLYDYERFVAAYMLPTPNGFSDLNAFIAELAERLLAIHGLQAEPLDQSLRHGTQTHRSLLRSNDPVVHALLAGFRSVVDDYRSRIGRDAEHPFLARNSGTTRFTGCWSVRLHQHGFHVNHTHPEGWISSAFYVQLPSELQDAGARRGWIKFGEPGVPGVALPAEHYVQPKPGMLVLFPSYMWHGTVPILGTEARLTAAFDCLPS